MRLSIIIPVYQTRNTLNRCVDSILTQDFRDWQMILVDDASTDGSAKICENYAKKEGRIQHVRLKRNSGLSVARNAGLAKAKGDYIMFVDSDDYLAPDTLKELMEQTFPSIQIMTCWSFHFIAISVLRNRHVSPSLVVSTPSTRFIG